MKYWTASVFHRVQKIKPACRRNFFATVLSRYDWDGTRLLFNTGRFLIAQFRNLIGNGKVHVVRLFFLSTQFVQLIGLQRMRHQRTAGRMQSQTGNYQQQTHSNQNIHSLFPWEESTRHLPETIQSCDSVCEFKSRSGI